jgi:hypothetical protein
VTDLLHLLEDEARRAHPELPQPIDDHAASVLAIHLCGRLAELTEVGDVEAEALLFQLAGENVDRLLDALEATAAEAWPVVQEIALLERSLLPAGCGHYGEGPAR